jgi:GT2 family glycosyltransferase/2-polyprenyl-3-methyl-5-hydroxy-6-metoxy-1,4-benzoquinol methylase
MKLLLSNSDYQLNPQTNVWSRSGYEGIAYSDGDEIEQRITGIVKQASDITVLSTELRQHCTDWPSLYHLSGTRANILRPFEEFLRGADVLEIGAGCGAITRYLGECGANVLALEGTLRRAAIARSRARDLPNVMVVSDRFGDFKGDQQFDVITLIGVLEYANLFTEGENPALAMLERIRSMLKPEGKLIIAIENQLGLKYFAGALEDHIGQAMYGIEGRYQKNQPQTFGRKVLADLLKQAGFASSEFLAPFPDYKLPVSIITEVGINKKDFDAAAFAWQSVRRDPQLPPHFNFSLELAWPEIFKNGLGLEVANSFLIVASPCIAVRSDEHKLAYHYSTDRAPRYCKEAIFRYDDQSRITVSYRSLNEGMGSDDNNQAIHADWPAETPYIKGKPLSWEFIQIVSRDGWRIEDASAFIKRYVALLAGIATQNRSVVSLSSAQEKLPGYFFDIVPQNIIIGNDGIPVVIDQEWTLNEGIELGRLLFRSLLLMVALTTRFGRSSRGQSFSRGEFVKATLEAAGYPLAEEDFSRFIEQEALIQQHVTGRSAIEFLHWWPDQLLPSYNLNQVIAERDRQIANLNQVIAEQNGQIENLNQAIVERNEQIENLNQAIVERNEQIENLSQVVTDQQNTIFALLASTSWRITRPIRALKEILVHSDDKAGAHTQREWPFLYRNTRRLKLLSKVMPLALKASGGLIPAARRGFQVVKQEGIRGLKLKLANFAQAIPMQPAESGNSILSSVILLDLNNRYQLTTGYKGYVYIPPRKPSDFDPTLSNLEQQPIFSIIVPLYNTPSDLLRKMLASVTSQWYTRWELILVDDASPSTDFEIDLANIDDPRVISIKLSENRGIAGATNAGLARATGEFVVFLDHDDELTQDCLFELAICINRENPDFVYSDEDKISSDGRFVEPHFKPDWSPDTLMSTMFVCHVSCMRRSLLMEIGGLRSAYDGCQDWDVILRLTEKTGRISHIPKVLYHWRIIPASIASDIAAKPYVLDASIRVREDALKRRGLAGKIEPVENFTGYFRVNYALQNNPLISIIIPSRDNGKVLNRCVDSIFAKSSYRNFEIVILDNGSIEEDSLSFLKRISAHPNVRVIRHAEPFNYSELNNIGIENSEGSLLLFLNDDTEVISEDWLERMGGYAQLPHIGAVGAKLLYPGKREIQHAGVVNFENGPGHAFSRQKADIPGYYMRNLLEYNWLAVTGACLMIERTKVQIVGGFDEEFPIAYNDIDLCFRLRDAGLYNVVCQSVRLIHYESISRGLDHLDKIKRERLAQERGQLYQKHPIYFQYDPFHSPNLHPNGINFELAE